MAIKEESGLTKAENMKMQGIRGNLTDVESMKKVARKLEIEEARTRLYKALRKEGK